MSHIFTGGAWVLLVLTVIIACPPWKQTKRVIEQWWDSGISRNRNGFMRNTREPEEDAPYTQSW